CSNVPVIAGVASAQSPRNRQFRASRKSAMMCREKISAMRFSAVIVQKAVVNGRKVKGAYSQAVVAGYNHGVVEPSRLTPFRAARSAVFLVCFSRLKSAQGSVSTVSQTAYN